jgi:hypothetical protein
VIFLAVSVYIWCMHPTNLICGRRQKHNDKVWFSHEWIAVGNKSNLGMCLLCWITCKQRCNIVWFRNRTESCIYIYVWISACHKKVSVLLALISTYQSQLSTLPMVTVEKSPQSGLVTWHIFITLSYIETMANFMLVLFCRENCQLIDVWYTTK